MSYYEERKHFKYYAAIASRLKGRKGNCIVDIGSADTPCVTWGEFYHRFTVDKKPQPPLDSVTHIVGDWPAVTLPIKPDLITCFQCIEHQTNKTVKEFTRALLDSAPTVLVSVPYLWEFNPARGHPQDPISLLKLIKLMHGIEPCWLRVVTDDGVRRLLAEFQTR